jgi:ABC-type Na+ efflux pump permease subunit
LNNKFRGWQTVFNFTFRQATKGAGFKLVTALVTIVIIAAFILINILVAKPEDKIQPSPVKSVLILDNSGLQPMNFKEINPELSGERFKNIEFINVTGKTREEAINEAARTSAEAIAVIITAKDTGYEIEAVIPDGSVISKNQASELISPIQTAFESSKLMQSGLSVDQLTTILKPVITSYADIGEDTSMITQVIKIAAPMLFGFILYFMLLLYGQTISKSVSTEKTSKLMETLLTSIHPYALITGKVLAITSMAVMQFVTWIVAAVVGLYGGNEIAHAIYPEYQNSVITIINYLKDNIGETAMSLPAVILAILIFCIGFLFYCVLAGLAGCMVSKPEDAANTQGLFVFPILISWLFSYITPITGNQATLSALRLVPFTIPFTVPVELITGTIGLVQGLISLGLLLAFSLLVIMLSARLYKGLILYNGQKLSMKTIGNILRAKS